MVSEKRLSIWTITAGRQKHSFVHGSIMVLLVSFSTFVGGLKNRVYFYNQCIFNVFAVVESDWTECPYGSERVYQKYHSYIVMVLAIKSAVLCLPVFLWHIGENGLLKRLCENLSKKISKRDFS